MNKYQRFILKNGDIYLSTDLNFNVRWQIYDFVENDENFVINQDNNYNIKKHNILFKSNAIEFVEVDGVRFDERPSQEIDEEERSIIVPIDFDRQASKITFNFVESMADPLTLPLKYVEADHSIYDSQVQAELNAQIKPECRTGIDLVNIYWNVVSDKVEETRIVLYAVIDKAERLIARFKETGSMFKVVSGLAFGEYRYEIVEIDKDGNEIARTPKISFQLSAF